MNIPEYNQRIIANPSKRTLNDVKEPQEFRDVSSQVKLSKELSNATDVAGDAFIQMKRQRDLGIVNQFMNDFDIERTRKIHELKNIYKGADSLEIVNAYQQWQDNYINDRIGQKQSVPEGTLYLENNEQIKEVKKQTAGALHTTINALSTYASASLNEYANQQADGRIFNLQEQIAREDNLEIISNLSDGIAYSVAQKYPYAPQEYRDMIAKQSIDKALSTDLKRMSSADPQQAMLAIQTPLFQKNMLGDSITTAKGSMVKDLIEQESSRVAEQRARGFDVELTINPQMYEAISPVLKEYGEEKFKSEVLEKAKGKQAAFNRSVRDSLNNKLNDATTRVVNLMDIISSSYDEETRTKALDALAVTTGEMKRDVDLTNLAVFVKGTNEQLNRRQELIDTLNNERRIMALEKREPSLDYFQMQYELDKQNEEIASQSEDVANAISRIDRGDYNNYADLIDENWNAVNKDLVLHKIASAQKFRTFKNVAKNSGYDVDKQAQEAFKIASAYSYKDLPAVYGEFKTYIKDEMLAYYKANKTYPTNENLANIATTAYFKTMGENEGLSTLLQVFSKIPSIKADLKKNNKSIIPEDLINDVSSKLSDDLFDDLSALDKKTIAKYIVQGNLGRALVLIKGVSND